MQLMVLKSHLVQMDYQGQLIGRKSLGAVMPVKNQGDGPNKFGTRSEIK